MRLFLGILIGLLLAIGVAAGATYLVIGDIGALGERDRSADISKSYAVAGFDEITVSGVYELNVQVGEAFAVELSGAPEEIERAEIEVEDGALRLGSKEGQRRVKRWRDLGVTAVVSMPTMSALTVSGVAEADIAGVDADEFTARLSGVGQVDIEGTCGTLFARVSGVGELDAQALKCADAEIRVSGIGEAKVYASQSADASVSGIGSIKIYGSPATVEKDAGLFSDISVK